MSIHVEIQKLAGVCGLHLTDDEVLSLQKAFENWSVLLQHLLALKVPGYTDDTESSVHLHTVREDSIVEYDAAKLSDPQVPTIL